MAGEVQNTIRNAIRMQLGIFSNLIDTLSQRWPSEDAFIARLLDQLVQDVEDLVRNRRYFAELNESHRLSSILGPLPLPSLPECYESCESTEATSQAIDLCTTPPGWNLNMYSQSRGCSDGVAENDGHSEPSLARMACENALNVSHAASTSTNHANGTGSVVNATIVHDLHVQTVNPVEIHLGLRGSDSRIVGHYQHLQPRPVLTPRSRQLTIPQKRKTCAAGSELTVRTTSGTDPRPNRGQRTMSRSSMYHSIASVDSLKRLRSTILSAPGPARSTSYAAATIAETMRVLDQLDSVQDYLALVRRVLLYRLSVYRDTLAEAAQQRRCIDNTAAECQDVRTVESETIDRMTQEIYPHTVVDSYASGVKRWRNRFVSDRKKIANRLCHAKKWKRVVDRFGLGMLALFPLGSELGAQNHRYETLLDIQLEDLMDIWEDKGGGFVTRAAAKLTPYVLGIYGVEDHQTTRTIQVVDELLEESARLGGSPSLDG